MGQEHDEVAAQPNQVFDESDDYISTEIDSHLNHRYAAGILEIFTEYYNGDKQGHPLGFIIDDIM